jgi:hypothetical protein
MSNLPQSSPRPDVVQVPPKPEPPANVEVRTGVKAPTRKW